MKQPVRFQELGTVRFQQAWDYQEKLLAANVEEKSARWRRSDENTRQENAANTEHHLLFLEHSPVYTLGKSGHMENMLVSEAFCAENHIDFFKINRGGDITFHGPGQLVVYPIFDLERFYTDIGKYLRNLEEVIIRTLADYGLRGDRSKGETGVWLDPGLPGHERKICAIGVRCSRWVTMHGLAFNVNTDLTYFDHIIPCGIAGKQVTSLQKELGYEVNLDEVKQKVKNYFEEVFAIGLIS